MHRKNTTDSSSYLGLRSSKSNNLNTAASNKQLISSSRNASISSSRQSQGNSSMNISQINEQSLDNKENINSSNMRYFDNRNNLFKSSNNFQLDAHSITILDRKGDNLNQQQETFRKQTKQASPIGIEGYMSSNNNNLQDQRSKQQQQYQYNSNNDNRRIEPQQLLHQQQQQKIFQKNQDLGRLNVNSSTERRVNNQNVNLNQQELPQRESIQKQTENQQIQDRPYYSLMSEQQQQQQQTQGSFKNLYQEILSSCGVRQPTKESRKSLNKSMQSNHDEQSFCKAETDSASRSFSKVDSDSINISALLNSNGQFGSIIPESYFTNETLGRQRALSSMESYQDSQQQPRKQLIASNGCLKNGNMPVADKQLMDEMFQSSQSRNRNPSGQSGKSNNTSGNSNQLSQSYSQANSIKQKIIPPTTTTGKSPQNSHFRSQNHEIIQEEQSQHNSNSLESQMLISRQNEINILRKELRISNHELLGSRSKVKTLEQEIKTLKTQMEQDKKQKQSGDEIIQKIKGLQFVAAQEKRISTRIITETFSRNEKIALVLQNLMKIIQIIQEKISFSKQSPERILSQIGVNLQPILSCILPVIEDIDEFNKQTFNLHGNQLGLKNSDSQQQYPVHEESSKIKNRKVSRDNYPKSEIGTAKTLKQPQKQQPLSSYQRQQANQKVIKPQQSSKQLLIVEKCNNKKTTQQGKQFRSISFDDMDYDENHLKNDISDNELRQSVSSVSFQKQGVTNDKKNMHNRKYFQPIDQFENMNIFKNSINEEKQDGNKLCRLEDLNSKTLLGYQTTSNNDQAGEFFQVQVNSHRKQLTGELALQKQSDISKILEESDFPNYQERKDRSCDSIQEQQGEYDVDDEKQSGQGYQMACSSERLFNNTLKGLKETLRNLTLDDVCPDSKNNIKSINKEEEQTKEYNYKNKSFREDGNCINNSYDEVKESNSQFNGREQIQKQIQEDQVHLSQQKSNQKRQNNDMITNNRILSHEEEDDINTFRTIEEGIIGISVDPDTGRDDKLSSSFSEKSTTQQEIDILKQRIAQRQSRRKLQGNLNKSSHSIHGTSISATSFRDLSSPYLS